MQPGETRGAGASTHVNALQLEVGVAVVGAGGVNAMLVADDLPELGTDLVAALAVLNVNDLPHLSFVVLLLLPAFSFTFKNNAIIDT